MRKIAYLVSEDYESLMAKAPTFMEEYSALQPYFAAAGAHLEKVVWTSNQVATTYG